MNLDELDGPAESDALEREQRYRMADLGAATRCGDVLGGLTCTRSLGHRGWHMAGVGFREFVASWASAT